MRRAALWLIRVRVAQRELMILPRDYGFTGGRARNAAAAAQRFSCEGKDREHGQAIGVLSASPLILNSQLLRILRLCLVILLGVVLVFVAKELAEEAALLLLLRLLLLLLGGRLLLRLDCVVYRRRLLRVYRSG